jgi:UDP-glucuronate 4-epimerase
MSYKRVLVTGAAGFIGAELVKDLLNQNFQVLGVDNFSPYYSPNMKSSHLDSLNITQSVISADVTDYLEMEKLFISFRPEVVLHLAAQGGVRASRHNPEPYLNSNQSGFLNILRLCETYEVQKLLYASSSSVYGNQEVGPFKESMFLSAPQSLYALSTLSNEIIASGLPSHNTKRIGMRFFTVYGPWGRPDMAVFRLLASAKLGRVFKLTAETSVLRDFTFVGDLVQTISDLIKIETVNNHEIFNIAGGRPFPLQDVISFLDRRELSIQIEKMGVDPLDVKLTYGSTEKLSEHNLSVPDTTLQIGLQATWDWLETIPERSLREWYEFEVS